MVKSPNENGNGMPGTVRIAVDGTAGDCTLMDEPTVVSGPGFGLTGLV